MNAECTSCSKEPTGTINVMRFIAKLDACFAENDLKAAGETIAFWEQEARTLNDHRGLLSVLNEKLGYVRRCDNIFNADDLIQEVLGLLDETGMSSTLSGATILTNAATTWRAFGKAHEAAGLYERAKSIYKNENKRITYEYATLLNNEASALEDLCEWERAEEQYLVALDILKQIGGHEGEIALTLVSLAHFAFDRDSDAYDKVESLLDEAWNTLQSSSVKKNANFAFALTKLVPSFKYFQRKEQAEWMKKTAEEIYTS